MSAIEMLLQELDQESRLTRRVLERVPDDRLAWQPHGKSWSMGQLALHVATLPGAIATIAQRSPMPVPEFKQASAVSAGELVPAMVRSVATAREALRSMDDAALGNTWRMVDGDREVLQMPVGVLLRTLMFNHWYHHRGQLTVYLRQVGVPVPSVYGPSADENPFATPRTTAVAV
jgi:uncharacterized damage-inducible protein DinB